MKWFSKKWKKKQKLYTVIINNSKYIKLENKHNNNLHLKLLIKIKKIYQMRQIKNVKLWDNIKKNLKEKWKIDKWIFNKFIITLKIIIKIIFINKK